MPGRPISLPEVHRLTVSGHSPDSRYFDGWMAQVETRHQSEQVQLQALITADGHPENTGQRQLQPGPAGCPRQDLADRQIILADRSRWQRQAELGDLPAK